MDGSAGQAANWVHGTDCSSYLPRLCGYVASSRQRTAHVPVFRM